MSLVLQNVSYRYMKNTPYEHQALTDINLTVREGEFVGIIGHTGSGKSTLLQHLNGLLLPETGHVLIDGVEIRNKNTPEVREAKQKVGLVFQYPENQLFGETIGEDIGFGPRNQGLSEEQVRERVAEAMQFVGLPESFRERSPLALSGGQMRRVAIAGIVALKPAYLVLDEPTAGLDPRGRDEIFRRIMSLHQKEGLTVILVSHNMDDVAKLADRIVILYQGRIKLDGTPREVFLHQRDKLQEAGLDVPRITALLEKLKEHGLAVSGEALSIQEAEQEILKGLGRAKIC